MLRNSSKSPTFGLFWPKLTLCLPNFSWTNSFQTKTFLTGHFFSWQKFFLPKLFGTKIFFAKFLWLFGWHFFWRQNFLEKILCYQNQFGPKILFDEICYQQFLWRNILCTKIFWTKIFILDQNQKPSETKMSIFSTYRVSSKTCPLLFFEFLGFQGV